MTDRSRSGVLGCKDGKRLFSLSFYSTTGVQRIADLVCSERHRRLRPSKRRLAGLFNPAGCRTMLPVGIDFIEYIQPSDYADSGWWLRGD
jgi:hypothetical protein